MTQEEEAMPEDIAYQIQEYVLQDHIVRLAVIRMIYVTLIFLVLLPFIIRNDGVESFVSKIFSFLMIIGCAVIVFRNFYILSLIMLGIDIEFGAYFAYGVILCFIPFFCGWIIILIDTDEELGVGIFFLNVFGILLVLAVVFVFNIIYAKLLFIVKAIAGLLLILAFFVAIAGSDSEK